MFRTSELATLMNWHPINASKDDVMRILTDNPTIKHVHQMCLDFKFEPKNLKPLASFDSSLKLQVRLTDNGCFGLRDSWLC